MLHNVGEQFDPAVLAAVYASAGRPADMKAERAQATAEAVAKWAK